MTHPNQSSLTLLVEPSRAVDVAAMARSAGLACSCSASFPNSDAYLDTFDGRLYAAGFTLSLVVAHRQRRLEWRDLDGQLRAATPVRKTPRWAGDLPASWREAHKVIATRALSVRLQWESTHTEYRLLDKREKTVAIVATRAGELTAPDGGVSAAPVFLTLEPLKGFAHDASRVAEILDAELQAPSLKQPLYQELHQQLGTSAAGTTNSFVVALTAELPAGAALTALLCNLWTSMRVNEAGMLAATDVEFLHDFRVAVRRSRSLVARLRPLVDPDALEHLRAELSWLGGITSDVRDLDVNLLRVPRYQRMLGGSDSVALEPLTIYLTRARRRAQRLMVRELEAPRYSEFMTWWHELNERALAMTKLDLAAMSPTAALAVEDVAAPAITKQWRRVRKLGRSIDDSTPASVLHELRIECKKLRYLAEAFRSLYAPTNMTAIIQSLKRLQNNLGKFQDYEIEQVRVREFAAALYAGRRPPEITTFLAMGRLLENLEVGQRDARGEFNRRWRQFDSKANTRFARSAFARTL